MLDRIEQAFFGQCTNVICTWNEEEEHRCLHEHDNGYKRDDHASSAQAAGSGGFLFFWFLVVTFGDMMSLLLTFFIMLVSLSEIKDDETYQKLVDSVQREFGYSRAVRSLSPGKKRPRKKLNSLPWPQLEGLSERTPPGVEFP